MKPSENILVMSDENAFKVLAALGNEYERRGFTNSSNLATFFVNRDFIAKSTNTKELITYYKPKIEQGRYSDLSISQTLLNGMVRSGYLKLDTGKYYLSQTGYNCYLDQNSQVRSFSRLSIVNRFFQEHQTLMFLLTVIGIGIGIASLD
ncbi:hypothetical protein [Vibrio cholerae]|uniref:hypothetical protein n=1 Tax=Vibrio cholerae TaxID=666 RepID=UPI0011DBAF54|nr:hypothetical protein [Vibrio cholerae]EGQ9440593.1 hypothetical protein [Vibrio cholerae]EHU6505025.1 hypothetical protein [Vibrio cholerae]EJL6309568.1 hypothetical protein [Vibrio cholerae]EJL6465306.1 hypothetical protein [Vibrio cholerae]EJL6590344.1 hypothetical protein [Vibrio cholerae]